MTEVISLINEKGGVGKSTSAITIAQILAISEYKVLLIDLDPQMNTTKMYGQAEANPDIDYERLFCEKQKNKKKKIFLKKKKKKTRLYSKTDKEPIKF